MPIVVANNNVGDLLGLAAKAGQAAGDRQRLERQQQIDQSFIQQALARAQADASRGPYGTNPGDYGYHAPAPAYQAGGGGGGGGGGVYSVSGGGAGEYASRAGQYNAEAEMIQARDRASQLANRRSQFKAAAAQGPQALAAFLAQDSLFTTGKVSPSLIDQLGIDPEEAAKLKLAQDKMNASGARGASGSGSRAGVSQFQRDLETQLSSGNASGLVYMGQRTKPEFDPNAAPGSPPSTLPTQEALQAQNALAHATTQMSVEALKQLRGQMDSSPMSPDAKAQALRTIDGALQQRQKERDVEIAQVYDAAQSKAINEITRSPRFMSMDRGAQLSAVGQRVKTIARQYGISLAELDDFLARQLTANDAVQDFVNTRGQPAPAPSPSPGPRTAAPIPNPASGVGQFGHY